MQRSRIVPLLMGCAGFFPLPATASENAELRWFFGAGAGITELTFDAKLDADTSFNTFNTFASASYGRLNATLTYTDTISEENISEEDETGSASRRDIDLALSWRLTDRWSMFAGYKDGKTEIDFRVRDSDLRQTESYAEDGLYAGLTYALPLGRGGTLNFSAAYIRFDSDLRFNENIDEEDDEDEVEALEFDDLEGRHSGDADGYSFGVSWVVPVADNLAVRTQYKFNRYDLKVRSDGQRFRPEQSLRYLDITLIAVF